LHFDIVENSDDDFLYSYLKRHAIAFRKMYKNINSLDNKKFMDDIIERYVKSLSTYRILKIEVESAYARDEADRMEKLEEISELNAKLVKDKIRGKNKKEIQRRVAALEKSVVRGNTFGGKATLRKINNTARLINNFDTIDKTKYKKPIEFYIESLEKHRKTYAAQRLRCVTLHGDAGSKGNRFFDFSRLDEGILIFKPENYNRKKVVLKFKFNKNQLPTLQALKTMALKKEIPITVTFGLNSLSITYDITKLNGTFNDMKAFYKTIKHIKDKELRKPLVAAEYSRHEVLLMQGRKSDRFGSIDGNPYGIGFSIIQQLSDSPKGEFKVLYKKYYNLSELADTEVSANKRAYELSLVIKDIFKVMNHYKACNFVVEDLSIPPKNHGNRVSNYKINNVWCRTRLDQMIDKRCNLFAIKKIVINPAYSSFIGNIMYDEYDPIAASIEIARRGMIKFIKNNHWLPEFHKGSIAVITDAIGDRMDDTELLNLHFADSWKDVFSLVKSSDFSVRRTDLTKFRYQVNLQKKTKKSKVGYLQFQ